MSRVSEVVGGVVLLAFLQLEGRENLNPLMPDKFCVNVAGSEIPAKRNWAPSQWKSWRQVLRVFHFDSCLSVCPSIHPSKKTLSNCVKFQGQCWNPGGRLDMGDRGVHPNPGVCPEGALAQLS